MTWQQNSGPADQPGQVENESESTTENLQLRSFIQIELYRRRVYQCLKKGSDSELFIYCWFDE